MRRYRFGFPAAAQAPALREDVMRLFAALSAAVLILSGCTFVDQIMSRGDGMRLDPRKIYVGTDVISVNYRQLRHYACVNGPLLCEHAGTQYQCRCNY
jgi:hypothetical protein